MTSAAVIGTGDAYFSSICVQSNSTDSTQNAYAGAATTSNTVRRVVTINNYASLATAGIGASASGFAGGSIHKGAAVVHFRLRASLATSPAWGDINKDGVVDALDVSYTTIAANGEFAGLPSSAYDLNQDSAIDESDADWLLEEQFGTVRGDIDLDADVDYDDLIVLIQNYNRVGTWYEGDFDGNGLVNYDDLLMQNQNYGFGTGARASDPQYALALSTISANIPEPSLLSLATALSCFYRRRRNY